MTYTEEGDRVTLEMTREDYKRLLSYLSYASGRFINDDLERFWRIVKFTNELNRTNPAWTQYEIPEPETETARDANPREFYANPPAR